MIFFIPQQYPLPIIQERQSLLCIITETLTRITMSLLVLTLQQQIQLLLSHSVVYAIQLT